MLRGALLAAFLVCAASSARAELGRDDQWTYVPANAEHGARAEFRGDTLDGPATDLMIQIECAAAERVLVFRYFGEEDAAVRPMALFVQRTAEDEGGDGFDMPTRRVNAARFEGRLPLTSQIVRSVASGYIFWIEAPVGPNEMDEPYFAGDAPPLRRVTHECWQR